MRSTAIKHSPILSSNKTKASNGKVSFIHSKISRKQVQRTHARTHKTKNARKNNCVNITKEVKRIPKHTNVKSKQPQTPSLCGLPALKRPRAKWSQAEDDLMMLALGSLLGENFVESEVKVNWTDVATFMNTGRNAKQCRDRWMNYLRPGLKKGAWEQTEEHLIKEMYLELGPKWCEMAKLLPNRSENDIKNKWYSMMRKQKRFEGKQKLQSEADLNSDPTVNDVNVGCTDVKDYVNDCDHVPSWPALKQGYEDREINDPLLFALHEL